MTDHEDIRLELEHQLAQQGDIVLCRSCELPLRRDERDAGICTTCATRAATVERAMADFEFVEPTPESPEVAAAVEQAKAILAAREQRKLEQGTEEWREARRFGIGGSEASVLYGCNPWMNEIALWAQKTGRIVPPPATIHAAPQLYWGTALEGVVRQAYSDLTGRRVEPGVTMLAHPEVPCLVANTDGTIVDVDGKPGPGVYEGKTASVFARRDWFDAEGTPTIPLHYQVQVQHYLACTGVKWASLAVYFGGDRDPLVWFDIERHDRLIADLLERAAKWWREHVELDVQPRIDDSAQTEEVLRSIAPRDNGTMVLLPDEFAAVDDRIVAIDGMRKWLDAERQRLRNIVIATMGESSYGQIYDGRGFSMRFEGSSRTLRRASADRMRRARRETGFGSRYIPPAIVPPGVADDLARIASTSWGTMPAMAGYGGQQIDDEEA